MYLCTVNNIVSYNCYGNVTKYVYSATGECTLDPFVHCRRLEHLKREFLLYNNKCLKFNVLQNFFHTSTCKLRVIFFAFFLGHVILML